MWLLRRYKDASETMLFVSPETVLMCTPAPVPCACVTALVWTHIGCIYYVGLHEGTHICLREIQAESRKSTSLRSIDNTTHPQCLQGCNQSSLPISCSTAAQDARFPVQQEWQLLPKMMEKTAQQSVCHSLQPTRRCWRTSELPVTIRWSFSCTDPHRQAKAKSVNVLAWCITCGYMHCSAAKSPKKSTNCFSSTSC